MLGLHRPSEGPQPDPLSLAIPFWSLRVFILDAPTDGPLRMGGRRLCDRGVARDQAAMVARLR